MDSRGGLTEIKFEVLGPLRVSRDGATVIPRGGMLKKLLAVLLCTPGEPVSASRLADALWAERPPPSARKTIQVYVRRLRLALGDARLVTHGGAGYAVVAASDELDALRFAELVAAGRAARRKANPEQAVARYAEALTLWRGMAYADVIDVRPVTSEAQRLAEERLLASEEYAAVGLDHGLHGELVGDLTRLTEQHPFRERLRAALMLALYRSGQQAKALEVYRETHAILDDELGVEPGPALQRIHEAILRNDPRLEKSADEVLESEQIPDPERHDRRHSGGTAGSPSERRPTTGTAIIPRQLPGDVTGFAGRTRELRQLDELMPTAGDGADTAKISVITGMAGVGKTSLALHWAHRMAPRFPDGQLYVNLRGYAPGPPLRPLEVLAQFLGALGVSAEQVPEDVDAAAAAYRSLLADRRLLVVLDNARTTDQVRPLLPGGPDCLVIITCRGRLHGLVAREGARRLLLDVLPQEEADALLTNVLEAGGVTTNPAAIAELSRLCAYLPLALRIAAANVIGQPSPDIARYTAELTAGNRLPALEAGSDEEAAMRAAFDLSYAALPADARWLFRLLSLVPGPDTTVDAAAALAGRSVNQVRDLLWLLTDAHLIEQDAPGRFAFHDLLRLYAAERTESEDSTAERQDATQRLLGYYWRSADAAARLVYPNALRLPMPENGTGLAPPTGFDDPAQAIAWLDAELPNLVSAIGHAAEHGPWAHAWLLADPLQGYFWRRMCTVDWATAAQAGLAAAEAAGDVRAQAAALHSLADLDLRMCRYQPAVDHYARALDLARKTDWPDGEASALNRLASVYRESGRPREAVDHHGQALAICRRTGWLGGQAAALTNLGLVYRDLGRLSQAALHHAEAVAVHKRVGPHHGVAVALANLGESYHDLGRLDEALDRLTQALALHREAGHRGAEAETLRCLAALKRDIGRFAEALDHAQTALDISRDVGDHYTESHAINTLGSIHHRLDSHDRGIECHHQALDVALHTGDHYPEACAHLGLAAGYLRRRLHRRAMHHAGYALTITREAGYLVLKGHVLTALAAIHLDQDEPRRAASLAKEALAIQQRTGHRFGEARAHLALGHALDRSQGGSAALPSWQVAADLLTSMGIQRTTESPPPVDYLGHCP